MVNEVERREVKGMDILPHLVLIIEGSLISGMDCGLPG